MLGGPEMQPPSFLSILTFTTTLNWFRTGVHLSSHNLIPSWSLELIYREINPRLFTFLLYFRSLEWLVNGGVNVTTITRLVVIGLLVQYIHVTYV